MTDKDQVKRDASKPQQSHMCEPFFLYGMRMDRVVVMFRNVDHHFRAEHDTILSYPKFRREAFRRCNFILPPRLTKKTFYDNHTSWEDVLADALSAPWSHFLTRIADGAVSTRHSHWWIETWRESSPNSEHAEVRYRVEIPLRELAEWILTNFQLHLNFSTLYDEIGDYVEPDEWDREILSASPENWLKIAERGE